MSETLSGPMYTQIRDRLSDAIKSGQLANGTRLTESIVADHFEVSRQTARNALHELHALGRIQIQPGKRGFFVVGNGASSQQKTAEANAKRPLSAIKKLKRESKWMECYDTVKSELLAVASTGEFRIITSKLAEQHDISRTVLNDIQFRLIADNILRLEGQRWILNRFDKETIAEQFAVRKLLEPYALNEGFDRIDMSFVQACLERVVTARAQTEQHSSQQLEELEADLHDRVLSFCGNKFLMVMLRKCRLVHVFNSYYYPRYHPENLFAKEHEVVLQAILNGDRSEACKQLVEHLECSRQTTMDRLSRFTIDNADVDIRYVKPL